MLTIRAIDIQNSRQQDVLGIYVGSESKKELNLRVKPLAAFENHPWITSDVVAEVISQMTGPVKGRVLEERAHQMAQGLNKVAPAGWTVRVAASKR